MHMHGQNNLRTFRGPTKKHLIKAGISLLSSVVPNTSPLSSFQQLSLGTTGTSVGSSNGNCQQRIKITIIIKK